MAATVTIRRWTGSSGGPTKSDITSINTRANTADAQSTSDTTNPIQIPASGSNYSFWVCTRLSVDVAPTTGINNLKWYTDGSNSLGTGVTCVGNTATTYVQATGTVGTTGIQLTTGNYSTLAGAPSDVFAFTSGSPKSVSGSIGAATGDLGDLMVYQVAVGSTAGAGATGTETFTWRYDET